MEGRGITTMTSRGRGALHPLLIGMCVGTVPSLPPATGRPGGPGAGRGEMSGAKCKFILTRGAENMFSATQWNLDISQSQVNNSANTAGQRLGYLKRRLRKQPGVTSRAAGPFTCSSVDKALLLLWLLPSSSSLPPSMSHNQPSE